MLSLNILLTEGERAAETNPLKYVFVGKQRKEHNVTYIRHMTTTYKLVTALRKVATELNLDPVIDTLVLMDDSYDVIDIISQKFKINHYKFTVINDAFFALLPKIYNVCDLSVKIVHFLLSGNMISIAQKKEILDSIYSINKPNRCITDYSIFQEIAYKYMVKLPGIINVADI